MLPPLATKVSWVRRFLMGLYLSLATLVDIGKKGLESYADTVGLVIHREAWQESEKRVS